MVHLAYLNSDTIPTKYINILECISYKRRRSTEKCTCQDTNFQTSGLIMEELTLNIQQSHQYQPKTSKRGLKRNSNYPLETCGILIQAKG